MNGELYFDDDVEGATEEEEYVVPTDEFSGSSTVSNLTLNWV